ncbi:MAG: polysaccharide deacetylase family protein [Candidatus Methanoplasma sp.]|jgi:peptidoglycan/xylan/chitin deacetylase (PgdA/CDA1 family)|nr:polysaccharide deacetylase family protein [Candidatus Methanoplasma sp.]
MRCLCFTVDLDRDVNFNIPGSVPAGSLDRGSGTGPRFTSTQEGLNILSDLLDDVGMKATFFAEGRTLGSIDSSGLAGHEVGIHGYDHEDLVAGNAEYGNDWVKAVLQKASDVVADATGKKPGCFRAPYMKINEHILKVLPEIGIKYDSSFYSPIGRSMPPIRFDNGLYEVPVPEGTDAGGRKISAYTWPMHEGKRIPEDYIRMASEIDDGIFNISTHTWHMSESRSDGIMGPERLANNIENIRKVLEGIEDMGFKAMTIPEAARAFHA